MKLLRYTITLLTQTILLGKAICELLTIVYELMTQLSFHNDCSSERYGGR